MLLIAQAAGRWFSESIDRLITRWPWLEREVVGHNSIGRLLLALALVLIILLLGRVARDVLQSLADRSMTRSRRMTGVALAALARSTWLVALVIALDAALGVLLLGETVGHILATSASVLQVVAIGYIAYQLVAVVNEWLKLISDRSPSKLDDMIAPMVRNSLRGTIVVLVLVQVASDLSNQQVTSIIAGLGVMGLAVGLAAQDTLRNFFGSVMLFGDRPFELGETITFDGKEGIAESVGFRSTRLRLGDGQLITIPNGDLASRAITNISRRKALVRRWTISLAPGLPADKVRDAVRHVEEILAAQEELRRSDAPQIFFSDITPAALLVTVQYSLQPANVARFNALNERINLEILRRFAAAAIPLAPPPGAPPAGSASV